MSDTLKMTKDNAGVEAEANVPRDLVAVWEAQGWKVLSPVEPDQAPEVKPHVGRADRK